MSARYWTLILVIALTTTACGGGGSSSDIAPETSTDTATPSSLGDSSEIEEKMFRVEVNFFGGGTITADGVVYVCDTPKLCSGTADSGNSVTFTAIPNPGWEFNNGRTVLLRLEIVAR